MNRTEPTTPGQGTTPPSYTPWRDLLAFGLSTAETLGVGLWTISCSAGDILSLHLDVNDPEKAREVAAALGVDVEDGVEHTSDKTYSIASRGPAPFYYDKPEPYPYSGASVPFGDRLVQISVACGLPADDGAEVAR